MDFQLSEEQATRQERVRALFAAHRRNDTERTGHDGAVLPLLDREGLLAHASLLDAVLVAEEAARAQLRAPVAVQSLLCGVLGDRPLTDIVVPVRAGVDVPLRFGQQAAWLLVTGEDSAALARVAEATPVKSNYIYPLSRVRAGDAVAPAVMPAREALMRWRLAIGAEIVGNMDGALAQVVAYLSSREQFGVKLGSLQALQHRLAEHAVSLESARWLVRDAAWQGDAAAAAAATGLAARAARALCADAHQLCGARGFTHEFGLERWTLRLQFLSMEAGGAFAHEAAAAELIWGSAA